MNDIGVGQSRSSAAVGGMADTAAVQGSESAHDALRTFPPLPAVGAAIVNTVLAKVANDDALPQALLELMEQADPGEHTQCFPSQDAWAAAQNAIWESTSNSEGFNLYEFLAKVIELSGKRDTQTRELLPLICTLSTVVYALNKASAELTARGEFDGAKREMAEGLAQGRTATGSYIAGQDLSKVTKHVENPADGLTGMQSAVEGVLAKWLGDSAEQVETLMVKLTDFIDGMLQQDASEREWAVAQQGKVIDLINKFNLDLASNAVAFGPRR
ncbi:Uncharacterised protein [Serratia quinivorans]|nr:Uncharacterised protein [Serratia quinivorans]